jgi:hypothetical protein
MESKEIGIEDDVDDEETLELRVDTIVFSLRFSVGSIPKRSTPLAFNFAVSFARTRRMA